MQKIVHFSCLSWLAASSLRPLWVPVIAARSALAAADEAGTAAYSQEHGGSPAVLLAFVVPLHYVFTPLTLKLFCGGTPKLPHLLLGIDKNPLVGSAAPGAPFPLGS